MVKVASAMGSSQVSRATGHKNSAANRSSFPHIVVIPTRSEAKGGTCFSFAAPVLVWDWLVWKGHSCPLLLTLILGLLVWNGHIRPSMPSGSSAGFWQAVKLKIWTVL